MYQKTVQLSHKLLTLFTTTLKQPKCHYSNLLGHIWSLEWVKFISLTSADTSTTPLQDLPSPPPLLQLLDVPCPNLKSLFLCHLARVHQEDHSFFTRKSASPFKNVLSKAPLTFTRKSTLSQDRACKCTFDFHSQVTSPLKNVLASALLTFTHRSLRCCLHPIREGLPLWYGLLLWCSHRGLASLIQPSGATHPAAQDAHCGLGFARGTVSAQVLPTVLRDWVALYSFLSYLWRKFLLE